MARIEQGALEIEIQQNRNVSEKNDGTLAGSVIYTADQTFFNLLPQLGASHPDDNRLECYQRDITYNNNGIVTLNAAYFGLVGHKTDQVVSFTGGQNNDPIEVHPDFATIAGTDSAPLNGARFNRETGEFLGFFTGKFMGVSHYLTPSTMISLSYWTDSVPSLKNRLSIVNAVPGVTTPPDVVNFLLLDMPYRQVGSFYQVTEQYLGSGAKGWNSTIYTG